jgi:multicomponent Na+:H+ antiporter subunit D
MAYGFFPMAVILATAFIIPIVSIKHRKYISHIAAAGTLATIALMINVIPEVLSGGRLVFGVAGWEAPFGISIVLDPLSVFMALFSLLIGFLVIIFSHRYIRERKAEYYSLVCLALVGTLGIIITGDLFNLFVYLEIMSVSSYALVAFNRDKPAVEASIKYLIIGSIGTSLILLGIAFLYGLTGTLNIADIALKVSTISSPVLGIAFGLILTGFAVKAGLMPFHAWLPDAYQASPSPISAIFAGVTTNVGIYAMIRVGFIALTSTTALLWMFIFFGLISMVGGAFLALVQSNLKRLLGYSSISQMGYIAVALGLGTALGISAGILHIINQALIKGLLFLCTAFVVYQAKTDNIYKISGHFKFHPVVAYSFLIGGLSLVGLPLFNGFVSKWMIYVATLQVYPILTVIALMVSVITLAYILKAFYLIFLGNVKPAADERKIPLTMQIPMIVLVILIIALGVMPEFSVWLSELMASSLNPMGYIGGVLG